MNELFIKLKDYLNTVSNNNEESNSFGFENGKCTKYRINDDILCVLFESYIMIDIYNNYVNSINKNIIKKIRIVHDKSWLYIDITIDSINDIFEIIDLKVNILKNKVIEYKVSKVNNNLTGEDIDMFNEREYEYNSESIGNTCDNHIDGA